MDKNGNVIKKCLINSLKTISIFNYSIYIKWENRVGISKFTFTKNINQFFFLHRCAQVDKYGQITFLYLFQTLCYIWLEHETILCTCSITAFAKIWKRTGIYWNLCKFWEVWQNGPVRRMRLSFVYIAQCATEYEYVCWSYGVMQSRCYLCAMLCSITLWDLLS